MDLVSLEPDAYEASSEPDVSEPDSVRSSLEPDAYEVTHHGVRSSLERKHACTMPTR